MAHSEKPPLLITGGAGFIGSNFVHHMIETGARVVTLDALSYSGNLANLSSLATNPAHVFVRGSIGDRSLVDSVLERYRPRAIVNIAAESHVDRSIDNPRHFIDTNIVGTFELLDAARVYVAGLPAAQAKKFRFLHISTDEVYGSIEEGSFTEDSAYAPNSPYAASKASADHIVRAYFFTYGLSTLTTKCSNNYGPHQFPEKLIPTVIINALEGRPLPVYGDGLHVRDWLYVSDHCRALALVLRLGTPGATYNIGGGMAISNIDLVQRVCALLDQLKPFGGDGSYAELITHVRDRPGHDRRYAIDWSQISTSLGWRPQVSLDEGLERTVRWYLDNREWWEELRQTRYGGERLGTHSAV